MHYARYTSQSGNNSVVLFILNVICQNDSSNIYTYIYLYIQYSVKTEHMCMKLRHQQ